MKQVMINGNPFRPKHSYYNAQNSLGTYKNKIFDALNSIGVTKEYVDVEFGGGTGQLANSYAKVTWHINGKEYVFRSDAQRTEIDNLAAIAQVIDVDCRAIRRGIKDYVATMRQYDALPDYSDGPRKRHWSQVFDVPTSMKDLEYLNWKYKQLAKKLHPDSGGSDEAFQELQEAWKEIQQELQ